MGESVLNREHTGLFVPLKAEEFAQLTQDQERREAYLDVLSYMHDLVAPYWDHPEPSRLEAQDASIGFGVLVKNHFKRGDSLSEHVEENAETAKYFAEQGRIIQANRVVQEQIELRRAATRFMRGLLYTYERVRCV